MATFDPEECHRIAKELGITSERKVPKAPDLSKYDPETRQKIMDCVNSIGLLLQKEAALRGITIQELFDEMCDYCGEKNAERQEKLLGFKPPTDWKPGI